MRIYNIQSKWWFGILVSYFLGLFILFGCSAKNTERDLTLALQYYSENKISLAEDKFLEVLRQDGKNSEACLFLQKIYFMRGDDNEFMKYYKKNLKIRKNVLEAKRLLANKLIRDKKELEAIDLLEEIISEYKNDVISLYLLGIASSRRDNKEEALMYYDQALGVYSYLKEIHKNIAAIYRGYGVENEAEKNEKNVDVLTEWGY